MFHGIDPAVYDELCVHLEPIYKTEKMEITTVGEIPDALYIVRFGVVSVQVRDEWWAVLCTSHITVL